MADPCPPPARRPLRPPASRRCAQLAGALTGHTTLKALDVGGNNIGPDGAKALAAALRGNEALRSLELGYNPIGPEGAKAMSDLLKYDMKVSPDLCMIYSRFMVRGAWGLMEVWRGCWGW